MTPAQRDAAQRTTLDRAASLGIAAIHECAGPTISGADDLTALLELASSAPGPQVDGLLGRARIARGSGASPRSRRARCRGRPVRRRSSRLAHRLPQSAPTSTQDTLGASYVSVEEITDHVIACTRAGLQAGFHAIGDAALASVVAGFEAAAGVVGLEAIRLARHRIEHAEMLDADLISRLARLGVVASVQPIFDALWGGSHGMYTARLGLERARGLNPFAAMASAGVPLAFGSDAPVTPLGGWEAVRAAAQHQTSEHALTPEQAFAAHTGDRLVRRGCRRCGDPCSWPAGPPRGLGRRLLLVCRTSRRMPRSPCACARSSPAELSGRIADVSAKLLELDPAVVRRARSLARKAGAPVVKLAKTHTTVSVERAVLRLAGSVRRRRRRNPVGQPAGRQRPRRRRSRARRSAACVGRAATG